MSLVSFIPPNSLQFLKTWWYFFALNHTLKVTLEDACHWPALPAHLARAVQVFATPKIMCFSYKRTCKRHQYETNIFCSLDPFRYLQHLNEVAISWHSEKLQVCWFFHNGATSRHKEGTGRRPISLLDITLLFSIFCTLASDVWWPRGVTKQNPVMSRDKHTHHLGHINKGSIVYRLGII